MNQRKSLFRKYLLTFGTIVSGSLLVSGLIGLYFSHEETKSAMINLQHEKAEAAASRIGQYLIDIEQKIAFTLPPKKDLSMFDQRRIELESLRQISAITEIVLLDSQGMEQLRTSRLGADILNSNKDHSQTEAFRSVKSGKPYRSQVYFRDTEPYMTIALAIGSEQAGVTVAQINLEFLLYGISNIKVSRLGHAYAVDAQGQLIAHPNLNLVLNYTNLSNLPQIKAARRQLAGSDETVVEGVNLTGQSVLTTFGAIPQLGWLVFVEQPQSEVLHPLYVSMARTGLLLLGGMLLSLLASMGLVRKMVTPIHALQKGAMLVGAGSLDQRIEVNTGDELEDLADQFNSMASQLRESYADLERKVSARTTELVHQKDLIERQKREVEEQKENVELAHRNISVLSEIGREITATLDRPTILAIVHSHVNQLMAADVFSIGFCRDQEGVMDHAYTIYQGQRSRPYTRCINDPNQLSVWCMMHWREVFINDLDTEYAAYIDASGLDKVNMITLEDGSAPPRPSSLIYVPMIVKERVLGTISVQSTKKNAYQQVHLNMLLTLASYAAVALDNAEAYRQLQGAQQQLAFQEKMASLGTLTAGVAHEINNPANFSHVGAQALSMDLERFRSFLLELAGEDAGTDILNSLNKRIDSLVQQTGTIVEGTTRIKNLVLDLRTFSRLDQAAKKVVNIADSLISTVNLVRTQYAEITKIDCQLDANPLLECFPAELNQVFMNLIVNACQAIQSKQNDKQEKTMGLLAIRSRIEDAHLVITFEDNGGGIPKATINRIFEPFFTTKTVGDGMGLGLSISFGIIEKHNGTIKVTSVEGEGTCFSLRLPLALQI